MTALGARLSSVSDDVQTGTLVPVDFNEAMI
jgi:hypothetical protein